MLTACAVLIALAGSPATLDTSPQSIAIFNLALQLNIEGQAVVTMGQYKTYTIECVK